MGKPLRIAGTIGESIVDGPGLRYVVFTQGCPHHCAGCHNPETHDFAGGTLVDTDVIAAEIAKNPLLSGVTFSGGEPFCQAEALCALAARVEKPIMIYTGYTFEALLAWESAWVQTLLERAALLVDGMFEQEKRNLQLRFRGSENQRILDVPQSLQARAPIWAQSYR